jgi:DNA-binding transcriptional LysR family regulator
MPDREAQCSRPLFRKAGRRLELNAEGERVLAAGRRMLALNDQLLESLRSDEAETRLRLGVPQDVAERWLPEALARFSRARPRVQLEVRVENNLLLRQLLADGGLDLAVTFDRESGSLPSEIELPVRWLAHPDFRWDPRPRCRWCSSRRRASSVGWRSRRWTARGSPGGSPSAARASPGSGLRSRPVSA